MIQREIHIYIYFAVVEERYVDLVKTKYESNFLVGQEIYVLIEESIIDTILEYDTFLSYNIQSSIAYVKDKWGENIPFVHSNLTYVMINGKISYTLPIKDGKVKYSDKRFFWDSPYSKNDISIEEFNKEFIRTHKLGDLIEFGD